MSRALLPRAAVGAAVLAAALSLPAAPAHAAEVQLGEHVGYEAYDDASLCFVLQPAGPVAGLATATGVVRTPTMSLTFPTVELNDISDAAGPTTLVSEIRPIATLAGTDRICVGGVSGEARSGRVVFTLDLHGLASDIATVVTCTYSAYSPTSCA